MANNNFATSPNRVVHNSAAMEEDDDEMIASIITDIEPEDNGDSMDSIYRGLNPYELSCLPEVHHSSHHSVLYRLPIGPDESIPPTPLRGPDKWDSYHVRLPCSVKNQYPIENPDGTEHIKSRWSLICATLDRDLSTSQDLEAAILTYNTKYNRIWKFRGLHALCAEMDDEGRQFFFDVTLPGIVRLALQLPEVLECSVPLLKSGRSAAVSFSQQQIASLLANAFLCTFPRRNTQKRNSEYRSFPDINFNRLFQSTDRSVLEKLKCVLHYFQRVSMKTPVGVVTIARRCWEDATSTTSSSTTTTQSPPVKWDECPATFNTTRLHVTSAGTIEDQGVGLLQVDFANKYLGGGVLGRGCVQEEIRFVICPELFVTKLIAEVLQPNEALFMVGCERFSAYSGYASSFTFAGEFDDRTPFDQSRRRCCAIVAIDALNFSSAADQYRVDLMRRELNKAHVGFGRWLGTPAPGVATGNWGCGAFGGDKRLKALLQLMVCCVVSRPLVYYTFGDWELRRDLLDLFGFLKREKVTVAELWSYLKEFGVHKLGGDKLYSFIYQSHQDAKTKKAETIRLQTARKELKPPEAKQDIVSESPKITKDLKQSSAVGSPSSSFSWPFAKKQSSPTVPKIPPQPQPKNNHPPTTSIIPKPKPEPATYSLLACLDTYYDKNDATVAAAAAPSSPQSPSSEGSSLTEVLVEEPPIKTATTIIGSPIQEQRVSDSEDNNSAISATPPTPPDRKRSTNTNKTTHQQPRQTMISEFLKKK